MYEKVDPSIWEEKSHTKRGVVKQAYQSLEIGEVMEVPMTQKNNITNNANHARVKVQCQIINGRLYVRRIE